MEKILVANGVITMDGRTYQPGDKLPTNDEKIVSAWEKIHIAEWKDVQGEEKPEEAKAKEAEEGKAEETEAKPTKRTRSQVKHDL